ncbi:putative TLD [Blattamonas nauphoetae]|uniref:Oxidation resistance protein 1 n=1 Tax=Blattamonas nauphoetae TaxID=2049346 RepID=A0ABQ9WWL3_9EUKA|nr:putative TLD [Blattamonas nauphoetae]
MTSIQDLSISDQDSSCSNSARLESENPTDSIHPPVIPNQVFSDLTVSPSSNEPQSYPPSTVHANSPRTDHFPRPPSQVTLNSLEPIPLPSTYPSSPSADSISAHTQPSENSFDGIKASIVGFTSLPKKGKKKHLARSPSTMFDNSLTTDDSLMQTNVMVFSSLADNTETFTSGSSLTVKATYDNFHHSIGELFDVPVDLHAASPEVHKTESSSTATFTHLPFGPFEADSGTSSLIPYRKPAEPAPPVFHDSIFVTTNRPSCVSFAASSPPLPIESDETTDLLPKTNDTPISLRTSYGSSNPHPKSLTRSQPPRYEQHLDKDTGLVISMPTHSPQGGKRMILSQSHIELPLITGNLAKNFQKKVVKTWINKYGIGLNPLPIPERSGMNNRSKPEQKKSLSRSKSLPRHRPNLFTTRRQEQKDIYLDAEGLPHRDRKVAVSVDEKALFDQVNAQLEKEKEVRMLLQSSLDNPVDIDELKQVVMALRSSPLFHPDSKPSQILQEIHFLQLSLAFPSSVRFNSLVRIFSSNFDGISFIMLEKAYKSTLNPTLTIIHTNLGYCFGYYAPIPLRPTTSFVGNATAFVFQVKPFKPNKVFVHNAGGKNRLYVYFDGQKLMVGGGNAAAILIDKDLNKGRGSESETYNCPKLGGTEEWEIKNLEVWDLAPWKDQ